MANGLDVAAPPGMQPNLGVAAAGPMPTVGGVFQGMGVAPQPDPATIGSGMGAAAAQTFPTVARLNLPPQGAPPPPRQSGMGAAAAAPPPMATAAPPPSALQSAQVGTEAEAQALADFLAANPVRTSSRANPMRPIVEKGAQQFYGGGELPVPAFEPAPMEPLPRNEGESDEEYADRMATFREVDLREQREQYDRDVAQMQQEAQTLGDVRDIGAQGQLGMAEATIQAQEGVGGAQIEQQKQAAEAQQVAAQMAMDATEAARRADEERRDFARQQRDALEAAQQVQDEARQKLEALPELDPQRYWKSQSGASRFFTFIGALAGGAIGSTAVVDNINLMNAEDLEAQKANAAQVFDVADTADRAVQQQSNLYRDLLDAAGTEAAADAMWTQIQLEDAVRLIEAQLAETTVPVMQAELQQTLVGLRQQIDQQARIVDTEMATTPRNILSRWDPIGKRQRKRAEGRLDDLMDQGFELQKLAIKAEQEGNKEEAARLRKQMEDQRKELRGEGGIYREAADLADEIAPKQGIIEGLKDLRRTYGSDIRGVGGWAFTEQVSERIKGATGGKDMAREFRKNLENTLRAGLRDESGAVLGEEEIQEQTELLLEGSNDIYGDEKVWQNIDAYVGRLENEIDIRTRGRSPEAVEYLTRNKAQAERDPITLGRAPKREVVRRK